MDYNVDNIESKGEINPTMNTDIILHKDGKFERAKIFGFNGKIKPAFVDLVSLREVDPIVKISTEGLVDNYRIYYTNGATYDFQVTNGAIIGDAGAVITTLAQKFDKSGGVISGPVAIGTSLNPAQLFNVFGHLKVLDDETKAVIIGETTNTAGSKFYVRHEDYNWVVPSGNPGMIGAYSDLYLHQTLSAYSTVTSNEAYTNISCAPGVINEGAHIGYLGGVMIMAGHRGSLGEIRGAQIVNRVRAGAQGTISIMKGVEGSVTAYGTNSTYIESFYAFYSTMYELHGTTINRAYGHYIDPMKRTGVSKSFGVYQKGTEDINLLAGQTLIGYAHEEDAPAGNQKLKINGALYVEEGLNASAITVRGNVTVRKTDGNATQLSNFYAGTKLRYQLEFGGGESDSDLGSNLTMYRFNDAGDYSGTIFSINRQTGEIEIGENLKVKKVKLKSDALEATPINGALEFDGTDLYFTAGGVRKKVTLT